MKEPKIKRYRLSVSRTFPKTHERSGGGTYFIQKIFAGQKMYGSCDCVLNSRYCNDCEYAVNPKIHTIRANYELWAKRMKEVQEGRAVIELFHWSGSPYNSKRDGSKQVVFATLDKNSGCGVQELIFGCENIDFPFVGDYEPTIRCLAKNDGLSLEDFKEWFKPYDLSKTMAIIHFTKFRY